MEVIENKSLNMLYNSNIKLTTIYQPNAPINVILGGGGAGGFDKAFMAEGVAFDFMDSPHGADI